MIVSCKIQSPCKDCPDRHVRCHSTCGKYIKFKEDVEISKKKAVQLAEQVSFERDITRNLRRNKDNRRKWGCYK